MANFLTKIFGTHSSHELKKIYPIADKVDALEEQFKKLTDDELRAKTDEFKQRYQNGETLDQLLPEAFATCREAAWRVLGMRHYRVQIIGGIVLHQGRIAEMKTGEGKTLVATLPAYLNALTGKGVHIVTVNDYLAKRDSEWMGKVYRFLGLKVGLVIHEVPPQARKAMYAADITYGTNNEFGFDYLRDNMAIYKNAMVQRDHAFAIVDEVDSILIDEARTPLIISGQGEKSSQLYEIADRFAAQLSCLRVKEVDAKEEQDDIDADYIVDEKAKTATLTPHGQKRAEAYFKVENLSDPANTTLQHHINQAIKARGVTIDVFGCGIDHDVCAKFERTNEKRGSYRIVDHERKIVPLCDLCKCRDVGHIQLWISNRLREDDSRLIRDLGFEICQIIRICKNCCNSKRFQIVVKINRSSIQAGACDDLITTSYDIQKGIGNCRHAGCTGNGCHAFFQNRHAFFKCCDGRVIDSCVRISSSFVVKQLLMLLCRWLKESTGLVHRGKCGSGHRISGFCTM